MCELFSLSARHPATVHLSFEEFSRHGGGTAHHADGWGLALYSGRRVLLLCEPTPASNSELVRFVLTNDRASHTFVSHIRKATQGKICLENTQPFRRALGDRDHVFAHNGDLHGLERFPLGFHRPIGDTDSERAFAILLGRLEPLWLADAPPTLAARAAVVAEFAADLRPLGIANFLYSDGDLLFAHGHQRTQLSGKVEPPGLHMLKRHCDDAPIEHGGLGYQILTSGGAQDVVLFASVPLSGEAWRPLREGELVVVRRGEFVG